MYYNPLTKEEEFHELVKEIEGQSAYKRQPPPEKKYMSVPEVGRLLGLKKTDRYWLVHKNFFKTEVILGKMRVEFVLVDYWKRYPKKAFDKWYGSQNRYRNAEDREKVRDILESSMVMPEMARLLGVPRSTIYDLLNQSEIMI